VTATDDPLVSTPPDEVPLENAPLVRVIAQVRFPLVTAIGQQDFIVPFQEAIGGKYPVLRQEKVKGIVLGGERISPGDAETIWRFADVEGGWRVSLAPGFLALETTNYESRSDFLTRLKEVVTALGQHVEPKLIDRLGVRYIDRISGEAMADIARLVRPEVLGIAGTALYAHAVHVLSESMFDLNGERVRARWGCLPPKETVDPAAIEATDTASWILDIDMFSSKSMPFTVDRVISDAARFAERIYTFFRWAVTANFLQRYGGKV
jgi:uncharacterized protein (TIGR04255 family)